jgi:lipopolysaccharide export system protein LptA
MRCKIHALQRFLFSPAMMSTSWIARCLWPACAAAMLWASPAAAEKADRNKPMTIDADKPMRLDYERQVYVIAGNVLITQGSLQLRAEKVELREGKDGRRNATAIGDAQRPATYRQKLDVPQEWAEATAERIEYDSRTETLRLTGNAQWRRLRNNEVADEISGHNIVWDQRSSTVDVSGGVPSTANPGGRVRAVFSPRPDAAASGPAPTAGTAPAAPAATAAPGAGLPAVPPGVAAPAASAAPAAPSSQPGAPLKPTRQLGGEGR